MIEQGSYSLLTDRNSEKGHKTEDPEEEEEDENEDTFSLDVHLFIKDEDGQEWSEDWGGYLVYVDETGEELQRITPKHNCATLVYIDSETKLFMKYVNCLAADKLVYHLFFKYFVS